MCLCLRICGFVDLRSGGDRQKKEQNLINLQPKQRRKKVIIRTNGKSTRRFCWVPSTVYLSVFVYILRRSSKKCSSIGYGTLRTADDMMVYIQRVYFMYIALTCKCYYCSFLLYGRKVCLVYVLLRSGKPLPAKPRVFLVRMSVRVFWTPWMKSIYVFC